MNRHIHPYIDLYVPQESKFSVFSSPLINNAWDIDSANNLFRISLIHVKVYTVQSPKRPSVYKDHLYIKMACLQ